MDPEVQQQLDQAASQIKSKHQAEIESAKAQAKKEAGAEIAAYLKSLFGI